MKVADLVFEEIKPLFNNDIQLVEVEYSKKIDGMHLTVYIDKVGGITIEDCVAVNDLIADKLDELNPTNDESYRLDVSSYGLDKPLKFDWQFKKYYDQKVNVKLYRKIDDRKEFVAVLKSKTEKHVTVQIEEENVTKNLRDIAYITPYIEF